MDAGGSAWELAHAAAESAGVSLVPLTESDDADRVSLVVARLWGEGELSPSLVRAFQHAGTGLYGAEAGGELVGFVLGFIGLHEGIHMHSHMLGVVPQWQSRGVGYALKLVQRAACLDAGMAEVRWTYDPLVARNAWFNLVKLGAVATAFLPGFYGEMTDRINRGDRSDRFEVRWLLTSKRVERALSGRADPPSAGLVLLEAAGDPEKPDPTPTGASPGPGAAVEIPRDHVSLRMRDTELRSGWRDASGQAFTACFEAGLVATWISRNGRYVFRPATEMFE
jgi:predicted GNAT superfamily acetyltransferase